VENIVKRAKKFGMSACGITDHGTVAGIIGFLKACREHGVSPILGSEMYQCRDHTVHSKEKQPEGRKGNKHLIVLAKNHEGYKNLCRLSQKSSVEGMYYDPRVDFDLLEEHKEGLMATSACLASVINENLKYERYDRAKKAATKFKDIFGEDFYLEAMFHGLDDQVKILPDIQKLGKELNIKIIVTNDAHYLNRNDSETHEVLMCMSSGRSIKDPKRIRFPYGEFFFKSQEEMYKVFGHVPSFLTNTLEVAEKCDYSDIVLTSESGNMLLPHFDLPEGYDNPHDYLCKIANDGLDRLGLRDSRKHVERLNLELSDIKLVYETKQYDFSTYFLIVHDMIDFAKKKKIPYGIRGSGYGSMLLRCLGLVNVDPLEYNLLWNRFLGFDKKYFLNDADFKEEECLENI